MHSSYKFCVIATGEFDFYLQKKELMNGIMLQAMLLLENAGAIITTLDNKPFKYGKE